MSAERDETGVPTPPALSEHEGAADLPPSAVCILITLHYQGDATMKQLHQITGISRRTIRYAWERLETNVPELVEKGTKLTDSRQAVYSVDLPTGDDYRPPTSVMDDG